MVPITQGPRSVGSPMINPNSNQSIATPQQSDATHDQRQNEQEYLDKVKQLGKYIEPLRRMIARIGKTIKINIILINSKLIKIPTHKKQFPKLV